MNMQLAGTYTFEDFNIQIIDPELIISPIVKEVNPNDMTISSDITLKSDGYNFGVYLTDIGVNNLDYNADELKSRVVERLEDFKI